MKRNSKEFYELREQFEKDIQNMDVYIGAKVEREETGKWFYTNEKVNYMFIGYMQGYAYAKCLARMDSLKLEE